MELTLDLRGLSTDHRKALAMILIELGPYTEIAWHLLNVVVHDDRYQHGLYGPPATGSYTISLDVVPCKSDDSFQHIANMWNGVLWITSMLRTGRGLEDVCDVLESIGAQLKIAFVDSFVMNKQAESFLMGAPVWVTQQERRDMEKQLSAAVKSLHRKFRQYFQKPPETI